MPYGTSRSARYTHLSAAAVAFSPTFRVLTLYTLTVLFLAGLTGCGSAEQLAEEPIDVEAAPETRPYDVIFDRNGQLVLNPGRTGQDVHIGRGGTPVLVSSSPTADAWAFALAGPDSSRLYLFDGSSGRVSLLHSGASDLAWSGAWASDGSRFAFGYRSPSGTGDIRESRVGSGIVERVGCVAAKEVLGWRAGGSLIVRDTDNIYLVERQGCATLQTIDARKMHHVAASPSGDRLAYVLRDLVYNREERSYEPDSSLYIRYLDGGEPQRIIGDRYSPRYPAWSPDGRELAYDVRLPDSQATRAVSIYVVETAQSSYLVPPTEDAPSRMHPAWSPAGDYLLFEVGTEGGATRLEYRPFIESFTRPVRLDDIGGSVELTAWSGPHHIFLRSPDGRGMLFDLRSSEITRSGADLVFVAWTGP